MRRRILALGLAVAVIGAAAATAPTTLAQFIDQDASSLSLSTDTLAPPTGLAATGTVNASLAWTPTADAYASGYEVFRSTTSGSGYALVSTVTPGSAASTTNAPGAGTFYYVLRSYFQNWRSVNSNEASVTLGQTTSGYQACTAASNVADTGGDNNGYELNPGNACTDDTSSASDVNTGTNVNTLCANPGKDRHRYWDFNLGIPASVASIDGIEVRLDSGMNNNGGTNNVCVELSWNGGLSWTTPKFYDMPSSTIATYALGAINDTWGRLAWTGSELSNANFRVRITDASSQPNKTYLLEYLAVQVTYTP